LLVLLVTEERAVLALTEAVTLIAGSPVADEVYEEVSRYFDSSKVAQILMAIVTINAWNRIGITTQMIPGSYQVPQLGAQGLDPEI
jgi:alkylhydroperoxidase family enzyme